MQSYDELRIVQNKNTSKKTAEHYTYTNKW